MSEMNINMDSLLRQQLAMAGEFAQLEDDSELAQEVLDAYELLDLREEITPHDFE